MRFHVAVVLLLAGCTPATTRPSFVPLPEALRAIINAPPAVVTHVADSLLRADSIPVRFVNTRDAFLESSEFAGTARIRVWADPDVPGKARVTVEAIYRPIDDPSRTRRDLERAAPPGSRGLASATKLLEALKDKLGFTTY